MVYGNLIRSNVYKPCLKATLGSLKSERVNVFRCITLLMLSWFAVLLHTRLMARILCVHDNSNNPNMIVVKVSSIIMSAAIN